MKSFDNRRISSPATKFRIHANSIQPFSLADGLAWTIEKLTFPFQTASSQDLLRRRHEWLHMQQLFRTGTSREGGIAGT
jgi:hypothetical protein